jgi:multimeric flavodoxin WrbA
MKVVAFNGSSRKNGNTGILLKTVMGQLEDQGIETELIDMAGKNLQGCIACFKCAKNKDRHCAVDKDELNEYLAKMLEADGILLGTPTYFADVSANMKALIERAGIVCRVNGDLLRRKVGAGVVAVRRAGSVHAFNSLNFFFFINQMVVPGSSYWNLAIGREPGEVENDTEGMDTMRNLGRNMGWLMKKINA